MSGTLVNDEIMKKEDRYNLCLHGVYLFSIAAVTNYHKLCGLKATQTYYFTVL